MKPRPEYINEIFKNKLNIQEPSLYYSMTHNIHVSVYFTDQNLHPDGPGLYNIMESL